jgi:FtsH-binding integral membrane protein
VKKSATETRMENFVIRSTPIVYGIVWALVIGFGLSFDDAWLIAIPTAMAYASMHVYEIAKRGHCYLSADSTAVPVSALVYVAAVTMLVLSGHDDPDYVATFSAYGGALFLGHVATMVCSAVSGFLLSRACRVRIEQERQDDVATGEPSS